jgi:PAS domain S-box-containing protein
MKQSQSNQSLEQAAASTQIPADTQTIEFHLGRVINAIPGFLWSALPDGSVEFCNQRWLDYTGMSLSQDRDEELATVIHPQDKSDFVEKWRAALTQGASFEAEARVRRADGCYRWFLIRAVPQRGANGAISRWFANNVDIEDLKRAQEEIAEGKRIAERLRESEARFQEMADTAPVMIWLTGTDGLCNYFNKPWLESLAETWSRKWAQDGSKASIRTMCKDASMASCPHSMLESLSGCSIGSSEQMENTAGSLRVVFRDTPGENSPATSGLTLISRTSRAQKRSARDCGRYYRSLRI